MIESKAQPSKLKPEGWGQGQKLEAQAKNDIKITL